MALPQKTTDNKSLKNWIWDGAISPERLGLANVEANVIGRGYGGGQRKR